MNYYLLAPAVIAALIALIGICTIVRVAIGNAHFNSGYALYAHLAYAGGGAALAAWLFSLAVT